MYSNKLAVAVKANGKVLREFGETVYVPFGTEYTLLIKNLNSVRVQVNVSIDGTEATDGVSLVIGPNQELELQRFIKNGNLSEGNRFKFIERTSKIENGPRGVKIDDGLIRIEYQFERMPLAVNRDHRIYMPFGTDFNDRITLANHVATSYTGDLLGMPYGASASIANQNSREMYSAPAMAAPTASSTLINNVSMDMARTTSATSQTMRSRSVSKAAVPTNDVGITVAGSKSTQSFYTAAYFPVDPTVHTMVIHLAGETESGKTVSAPVTVKAKPRCITCGHMNKATAKFCSECGTSLEIV